MFYVTRNSQGDIQSLSETILIADQERLPSDHPDVCAFLQRNHEEGKEYSALSQSDMAFIRVLEDLIDLLTDKDLIQFTELPPAAQQKLLERRSMREALSTLSTSCTLIADSDKDEILI